MHVIEGLLELFSWFRRKTNGGSESKTYTIGESDRSRPSDCNYIEPSRDQAARKSDDSRSIVVKSLKAVGASADVIPDWRSWGGICISGSRIGIGGRGGHIFNVWEG